jgi:hypothetical protein
LIAADYNYGANSGLGEEDDCGPRGLDRRRGLLPAAGRADGDDRRRRTQGARRSQSPGSRARKAPYRFTPAGFLDNVRILEAVSRSARENAAEIDLTPP